MAKFGGWSKFGGLSKFGGGVGYWNRIYLLLKRLGPPGLRPDDDDLLTNYLLRADAALLAHGKVHADRVFAELFPHKAAETLAEWETLLGVVKAQGDTQADRREALLAVWRGAGGASLKDFREALQPIFNSVAYHTENFDDSSIHPTWTQSGNGTSTEATTLDLDTSTADCRLDGTNDNAQGIRQRLPDRDDDYTCTVTVDSETIGTGGAGGIWLRRDFENIIMLAIGDDGGGGTELRADVIEGGTLTEDKDTAAIATPTLPEFLQIERSGSTLIFRYGDDADSLVTLLELVLPFVPREYGVYARNDASNATAIEFSYLQLVMATGYNNVRIIEAREADVDAAGDEALIFSAFAHRNPNDAGSYNLKQAQRLLDRIKQAHTVFFAGESDAFLCDDPFSLCDRDILGE